MRECSSGGVVTEALVEGTTTKGRAMGKQSEYLDRDRTIALEGRPHEVDWLTLLGAGRNAVQKGRADHVPFLSDVMWRGVDDTLVTPRPAALDHPFMRRWLAADEQAAIDYLCDGWGYALNEPEPETADEALALLDRPRCVTEANEWQHFMYVNKLLIQDGPVDWAVGYCNRCQWAVLMMDDEMEPGPSWWLFYDQETA